MSRPVKQLYEFGPFRLDPSEHFLLRDGKPVPLTPKAFDTLLVLVRNSGHLVEKEELMRLLWPNSFVEESNLNRNISMLRKALSESANDRYIETVPKLGYRFVAEVKELIPAKEDLLIVERHTTARIIAEEETEGHDMAQGPNAGNFEAIPTRTARTSVEQKSLPVRSVTDETVFSRIKRHKRDAVLAALILVGSAAAFALYNFAKSNQLRFSRKAPFETINLNRVTTTGKAQDAVISPDGKYIVHVMDDGGRQSLWLRQVTEALDVEIVEAAEIDYWGIVYSPDGTHIYYVAWERNNADAALYQIPVLGGPAKMLIKGIGSSVSFSPDGERIVYVKDYPSSGLSQLMRSHADGSAESVLATRRHPDSFSDYPDAAPVWSPNGNYIVSVVGNPQGRDGSNSLIAVRLADGSETMFGGQAWSSVQQIAWLADSSGIIMTARDSPSAPRQVWRVSFPGGEVRRITNDLSDYRGVSLTRDTGVIATVQTELSYHLWVMPGVETNKASRVASEVGTHAREEGVAWTPDGRIVYRSNASGNDDIWIITADGRSRKQLTANERSNIHPTVSPDGRYVVFASDRTGDYRIWRMHLDGSSPMQLTDRNGSSEVYPTISKDGRLVVFQLGFGWVKGTLWKVSIDGGTAVQLTEEMSLRPAISPDGKSVAYYYMDANVWGLEVISLDDGQPLKRFAIPRTVGSRILRWTPDGQFLAYVDTGAGVSNIWAQSVHGGPPKQLTDFQSDRIAYFEWSRDGKWLACARGGATSDVVLISSLK
jgi:Tol biopolymer transport system component/DNA-binding winged helix-turn-helix (wHTH) protein